MSHLESYEDEPCEHCGSTTYFLLHGIAVCQNGHEQGAQVIGRDEADWGVQGKLIRKKVERGEEWHGIQRGPKTTRVFIQAYQFIIWRQCHTLIHEKDLPQELWTIVRDLWSLRLSKLLHRLESPQPTGEDTSSADERGNSEPPKLSQAAGKGIESPKLVETIGLCYIGTLLLRLPISLSDVYRWIQEEDVLYIRAIRAIPSDMLDKLPGEYHRALDTTEILQPYQLERAVSDLAVMYHRAFGLVLPKLNHKVLLYRYILILSLPLEIFPAVRKLAEITQAKLRYATPEENFRRWSLDFPERQIMSLIVIAAKLLYPFDGSACFPRAIDEPTAQKFDWKLWKQNHKDLGKRREEIHLKRGSELEICDRDVFKMTQLDMDAYMNWYQKTWVRESHLEPQDHVNQEMLKMFPPKKSDPKAEKASFHREAEFDGDARQRIRAATAAIRLQTPMNDEEASEQGLEIKRPGDGYRSFKAEEDLSATEELFLQAAARVSCTRVKYLKLSVQSSESRIRTWQEAKRRAEVADEDTNLQTKVDHEPDQVGSSKDWTEDEA